MKIRTVEYTMKNARITPTVTGGSHHRSVRSVFAVIAARGRAPGGRAGFVAVVVICLLPTVPA
jgi:hypothetical protein